MSADNWAECPKCEALHQEKMLELRKQADEAYGKVPAERWVEMNQQADTPFLAIHTLREDYEIGITDGEFSVSYRARCTECGFTFRFDERKNLNQDIGAG